MLAEIGSLKNVPAFIQRVKNGEGRLMGFGHRVYKSYDPRAKAIKRLADQVFDVTGKSPLWMWLGSLNASPLRTTILWGASFTPTSIFIQA